MKRSVARSIHASVAAVGVSGLVYAWMLYFYVDGSADFDPDDELALFSSGHHPWMPFTQWLHIMTAPALVFVVGLIWSDHVWKRIVTGFRARRRTGILLVATLLPMTVSGYAIQTSVAEFWRQFWIVVHVASSLVFLLGYLVHQVVLAGRKLAVGAGPAGGEAG